MGFCSPCPVAVVKKFVKVGNHPKGSPLFRMTINTQKGIRLRMKAMSFSRAEGLAKMELRKVDQDPAKIGIYSLRSAEDAAEKALAVSDRFSRYMEAVAVRSLGRIM